MDRIIEFTSNNWELVIGFLAALGALIFTEKRKATPTVTPQIATLMSNNKDTLLLDIRPKADFEAGHILNSKNIAYSELNKQIAQLEKHKDTPVIVICKAGQTSVGGANTLRKLGFTQVYRMNGGMAEWANQNLPLTRQSKSKDKPKSKNKPKSKDKSAPEKSKSRASTQSSKNNSTVKDTKTSRSKPKDSKVSITKETKAKEDKKTSTKEPKPKSTRTKATQTKAKIDNAKQDQDQETS